MRRHIVMAGLAVAALAGCSSAPDLGPVFDDEGGQEVSCLVHQTAQPGARYTDRETRNTGQAFAMLRYYTSHGSKAYCDGQPASDDDRAWAQVYLDLGGTPEKVTGVLG